METFVDQLSYKSLQNIVKDYRICKPYELKDTLRSNVLSFGLTIKQIEPYIYKQQRERNDKMEEKRTRLIESLHAFNVGQAVFWETKSPLLAPEIRFGKITRVGKRYLTIQRCKATMIKKNIKGDCYSRVFVPDWNLLYSKDDEKCGEEEKGQEGDSDNDNDNDVIVYVSPNEAQIVDPNQKTFETSLWTDTPFM